MTTRLSPLLLALALGLSGCVDAKPQLFVNGVCGVPDDPTNCVAPGGKCENYLNGDLYAYTSVTALNALGVAITYRNELSTVFEVQNLLPNNADEGIGRVNGHNAIIESAKITYSAVVSNLGTGSTSVLGAPVPIPGSNEVALFTPVSGPGTATIFISVVTATTMEAIAGLLDADDVARLVAHIKLTGHLTDGSAFETVTYDVPAYIYNTDYDTTAICPAPTLMVSCYRPGQTNSHACVTP